MSYYRRQRQFAAAQYVYENMEPPGCDDEDLVVQCPCCDKFHSPDVEQDYDEDGPCGASYDEYCPTCVKAGCEDNDDACKCPCCGKSTKEDDWNLDDSCCWGCEEFRYAAALYMIPGLMDRDYPTLESK